MNDREVLSSYSNGRRVSITDGYRATVNSFCPDDTQRPFGKLDSFCGGFFPPNLFTLGVLICVKVAIRITLLTLIRQSLMISSALLIVHFNCDAKLRDRPPALAPPFFN